MRSAFLKLTVLVITFLIFGLNLQASCADSRNAPLPNEKYEQFSNAQTQIARASKRNEATVDDSVSFDHGLKIGPNGIIKQSTRNLNTVFPSKIEINKLNDFPGSRGPGQLVVYKPSWGERTGTNEFGQEAIVVDDVVQKISGANSPIPKDGYVISGHGEAKTWINTNVKVGTKIRISNDESKITAYTTVESYRFQARAKIAEVEEIMASANVPGNEKLLKLYTKKAKSYLKKSDNDNNAEGLAYALAAIKMCSQALQYTVPYKADELHGVWIRPTERNMSEVLKTFDNIEKAGINAVFVETFFHGKTIFPSRVMKRYGFSVQNRYFGDFDALSAYVSEAAKRNIQIHIWFESFYIGNKPPSSDPESILTVKPMWGNKYKTVAEQYGAVPHPAEHMGYFLDPANPEVIRFLEELILEITGRYAISGVNLDYVRYPQAQKPTSKGYEMSNWGYTEYARSEFKQQYGVDPLTVRYQTSAWRAWDNYRQNKITDYVSAISYALKDRRVVLSAVVFPDEESCIETKQQDWGKWANAGFVDAITPLILTSNPDLAQTLMQNIRKKAGSKIKIYPGLFVGFMNGEPEDLLSQIRIMRNEKLHGTVLFDYAHLDPKYVDVIKTCAFSNNCK